MEWLSKDLIQLVKDNVISIVIVLYLLYKNNVISFKEKKESNDTNKNSVKTQVDIISILRKDIDEIKLDLKHLKDRNVELTKHDTLIEQHEKTIDVISKALEDIKIHITELRDTNLQTGGEVKLLKSHLENLEYKIQVLKEQIQSVEETMKELKQEQQNNKIMGDLKHGFR